MADRKKLDIYLDNELLLSDVDTVIALLQEIKTDNPTATLIETVLECVDYECWAIRVHITRPETDKEYKDRLNHDEKYTAERHALSQLDEKYASDRASILAGNATSKGAHDEG